jgi:hypothetical protein
VRPRSATIGSARAAVKGAMSLVKVNGARNMAKFPYMPLLLICAFLGNGSFVFCFYFFLLPVQFWEKNNNFLCVHDLNVR